MVRNRNIYGISLPIVHPALGYSRTVPSESSVSAVEILESIDDAFYALDEQWRFTYINGHAERFWRRRREDLLGLSLWDAFPGVVGTTSDSEFHRAIRDGRPVHFESRSVLADFWLEIHAYPRGAGLSVYFRDITERKRAQDRERLLLEAGAALSASLDARQLLQAVADVTVPTLGDYCIVYARIDGEVGAMECVGVAHADHSRRDLIEQLRLRSQAPRADSPIAQVIRSGRSLIVPDVTSDILTGTLSDDRYAELLLLLGIRSAMIVPLQARGKVLGAMIFVTAENPNRYQPVERAVAEQLAARCALALDNSRLFRAAQAAANRMTRLQEITAALSEALTVDDVIRVVVQHSVEALGAAAGFVGLREGDTVNVHAIGFPPDVATVHRETSLDAAVPLAQVVRTGEAVWLRSIAERDERYPALAKADIHQAHRSWASVPLRAEQRVLGVFGLSFGDEGAFGPEDQELLLAVGHAGAQAIERARRYEQEQAARREAEAAVDLRDQFLAAAAHELKTPVTSLRGFAQVLQRQLNRTGTVEPQRLKSGLATIIKQSDRLTHLVVALLDISRLQAGKLVLELAPTDLAALVRGVVEAAQGARERLLVTVTAPEEARAMVDALRIEQVVTNLLDNAAKFSPADQPVEVTVADVGSWVHIEVRDYGPGIPTEHRERIFERFYQVTRDTTEPTGRGLGMGLGLYLVRELVERHNGTIQVDCPPDGGSRFIVRLPGMQDTAPAAN